MACEVWLRRDYLIRRGREPDEPPCGHNPQRCPPHDRRPDPKEHLMADQTEPGPADHIAAIKGAVDGRRAAEHFIALKEYLDAFSAAVREALTAQTSEREPRS
jgi:hypothetical protein